MYKGDFILQCEVEPEFLSTYDAGAIFVCESPGKWIKLAFENTDLGYPSIVNVVTDKVSDDCNGEKIIEKSIWLQIVRKDDHWCTHYSNDQKTWKMVRLFKLPMKKELMAGVSAQSPLGKGCKVIFRNFKIGPNTYKDIRKAI
jgi:regulation of enolase protein 1 (concanavalin A-like superfamily)